MANEDDIARALMAAEDAGPPEDRPVSPVDRVCAFFLRNDIGNAERLIARFGDDLAFHPALGWGVWNGVYWDFETGGHMAQLKAQQMARAIYVEVRALPPPDPEKLMEQAREEGVDFNALMKQATKDFKLMQEAGLRFAKSSGNSGKVAAALTEAAPHRMRRPDEFDADPFVFVAKNKTLHLRKGRVEARPHHRGDLRTKTGACNFDPQAACPSFLAFLEMVQPDPAMRDYLQRFAGYVLTGDISEQALLIFHGGGRNGKGTFLNALRDVLGQMAITTPIETFGDGTRKDGASASPDIARMRSRTLIVTSDAPDNLTLSAGLIKQMTGQEPITARELHKAFIEFMFTGKMVIPCNPKPRIPGTDEGIWRRVHLVLWPVQIPLEAIDRHLGATLKAEAPGILNWMLEGYLAWQAQGLNAPAAVLAASQDYRTESDPLGEFLSVWTDKDAGGRASSAALFAKYGEYCKANAYPEPKSGSSFGKSLKARGFESLKSGVKVWLGLRLRDEARAEEAVARPAAASAGGGGWDAAYRLAQGMASPDPVERAGDDREGGGFDRPIDGPLDERGGNPFDDPFAEYDD